MTNNILGTIYFIFFINNFIYAFLDLSKKRLVKSKFIIIKS